MSDHHFSSPALFDATVRLQQDAWTHSAPLLDISLAGLLISRPDTWSLADADAHLETIIELTSGDHIRLEAQLAFSRDDVLALACRHLDLDSIAQLKELISATLGDPSLAERELTELGR
ncbi:PilZ domain-containing protein [Halopseudomonas bauzanensis]|uniref:PilZ domain-containing protein n=1 Tax=Halopseudomonas bauzanensis TaxID=653930 RepID=A0A1H9VQI8_9GAMM|nr:PilZ domain-containing protein [Halopseudomonas bauzanensis]SES23818.1 PilZ domain-containing protein [Halopseudomonas bauzanensis]SFM26890.1 PilZ domain-containing protein [Halopseudomonas bauzanensis]